MSRNCIRSLTPSRAFESLSQVFEVVSTSSSITPQVQSYAAHCNNYSKNPKFHKDFISCFNAKKVAINDEEIQRNADSLAQKSINIASNLTDTALSKVQEATLETLEARGNTSNDSNDDNNTIHDIEHCDDNSEDEDPVWRSMLAHSPQPLELQSAPALQYTPEKPKLTIDQIQELQSTCCIAIS
ncbi:hypothetical protein EC973_009051, partial [Apophysomyces ossiformis]